MAVDRGSAQSRAAHDGAEVVEVKDGAFLSFLFLFSPPASLGRLINFICLSFS